MTYLGKKVDIVFCNDACASIRFLDGALDSNVERQKAYFVIVEGLMKREVVVQIPDKLIDTASIRVVVLAAACGEAWEGTQDKYFGTRFVSDLLGHCLEKLDDAINVLSNHAEPLIGPASGAPSVPSAAAAAAASHSNGLMAAYTPVLEPHMVCHVRLG